MPADLDVDGRVVIPGDDLRWRAVRSAGPGGQRVNKVATKVVLWFDLQNTTALDRATKARLRRLAAGRIDANGQLVVSSQATRNRVRNLQDARAKLAAWLRAALVEPKKRRATRPTRASQRRRLRNKRRQADKKEARRKVPSADS